MPSDLLPELNSPTAVDLLPEVTTPQQAGLSGHGSLRKSGDLLPEIGATTKVEPLRQMTPVEVGKIEAEDPPMGERDQAPWTDPVPIIASAGTSLGRVGVMAATKALVSGLVAEPFIGKGMEEFEENVSGDLPPALKIPTEITAQILLNRGLARTSTNALNAAKSTFMRSLVDETMPAIHIPDVNAKQQGPIGKTFKGLATTYDKYIGSPLWDVLVKQKLPQLLEKVPGGSAVNRALIFDYRPGLDNSAGFNSMVDALRNKSGAWADYGIDLGKRLQSHTPDEQMLLGQYIRGETKELPDNLKDVGDEAVGALFKLGKAATDLGLLSEETFFKNAGKYMPRLYSTKEYQSLVKRFKVDPATKLDLSRFKHRSDIPKDIREKMGEILTPGYPVAKGVTQLSQDVEMARFYQGLSQNENWVKIPSKQIVNGKVKYGKVDAQEGWKQLPETKKLGVLSGAYAHPEVYRELEPSFTTLSASRKAVNNMWMKALGSWKFGKVILSPKTHVRNLFSNSVLAHLGGMPFWEQPRYLKAAAKEMVEGGNFWKAAKQLRLMDGTFANQELKTLFNKVSGEVGSTGSLPETVGSIGKIVSRVRNGMNKAADAYQAEEQLFKLAKMMHNMEVRGMNPSDAAKDASEWLFDYGKLTNFQKGYKNSPLGAPFATFTFKSVPKVLEAAVKTPWRFAAPMMALKGLEEASREHAGDTPDQAAAKKEMRPEWQQGSFMGIDNFTRVPVTDDSGRDYYLNLSYILPWGDISDTGNVLGIPGGVMPFSNPFIKEPIEQISNYSWFWKSPIVSDSDVAGKGDKSGFKKRAQHALQTFLPTPYTDIMKGLAAYKGEPDYRGRTRPAGVVAADVFGGFKMYPVDYAEQMERAVRELNPKSGYLARKLRSQIHTLAVKKSAMEKLGKPTGYYDKEIAEKIEQMRGLAIELKDKAEVYRRTK